MNGIYEQLNPRHMHLYTGYMDTFLADKQKVTNPMEGVTVINNGLWHAYPDAEFKFEPGNGIMDVLREHEIRQAELDRIQAERLRQLTSFLEPDYEEEPFTFENGSPSRRERRNSQRDMVVHTGIEGMRLFEEALRDEATRQLGISPNRLEQPIAPEIIWENPLRDEEGRSNYIVGFDPAVDSNSDSEGSSISVNVENIPEVEIDPEQVQRLMHSQPLVLRSRRAGYSSAANALRRQNELLWSQLRDPGELPASVSVVREFLTEQEAIEYLDSLSQNTTENEENTDTIQDGESYGFSI